MLLRDTLPLLIALLAINLDLFTCVFNTYDLTTSGYIKIGANCSFIHNRLLERQTYFATLKFSVYQQQEL